MSNDISNEIQTALKESRENDDPDDPYLDGVSDGYELALAWVQGLMEGAADDE